MKYNQGAQLKTVSLEIPQKTKLKLNQLTKYPADRQLRLRRLD